MDDDGVEDGSDGYEYTHASPTLYLPHLLCVLGPSSLTLHKHVLGRRRILIYTQQPSKRPADMCFGDQTTPVTQGEPNAAPQLKDIN
ncbi:hypothetical protein EDB89DRAFT_1976266, partial [Lactarius sanguifluus]